MGKTIRVYGEFRLTSTLARRVHTAVEEFTAPLVRADLSHLGDDCAYCRCSAEGGASDDASESDRANRAWDA